MSKLFLSLDDAVLVAKREFGIDQQLARQEFEQKCYITDDQYAIGYNDGLCNAIDTIESLLVFYKVRKNNETTNT